MTRSESAVSHDFKVSRAAVMNSTLDHRPSSPLTLPSEEALDP